jgi:hypothetical protein
MSKYWTEKWDDMRGLYAAAHGFKRVAYFEATLHGEKPDGTMVVLKRDREKRDAYHWMEGALSKSK